MASGLYLFVVPLDRSVNDQILKEAFSAYGELFDAVVATDENGVSKGYGFVHFCSVNDGLKAKDEMDSTEFYGRTIHVKISHKQEGKCYSKNGSGNAIWASNWDTSRKPTDDIDEEESVSDVQSQCSYAVTIDSNSSDFPDVRERMKKLFEQQSFTDVTFYPKGNRRISLSAHRAILAISSPLFTKMLYDDQNKVVVGEKLEVQISNLPFEAFTRIVKYIYLDEVSFDNEALAQGIFDAAKQFGINPLVERCKEYFENLEVTCDNVCSKLQMSVSYKITPLKEKCIDFIQKNTLSVLQSSDFKGCNFLTVKTICKLQSLNLRSEVELLEAVIQWMSTKPSHERKNLLEPLLKCIRFLNLTVTEMGDTLKKYPDLMTANEGLSIVLLLYNPLKNANFTSLPSWCNKNMQNRCFFQEDVRGSQMGLNVFDSDDKLVGKISFPLKPDPRQGFVSGLTSLLQMKCIRGFHIIKAIRLHFEKPMSDKCKINNLLIKVHVNPSNFDTSENVQIVNSESVYVKFTRLIKVRRGDTLDIEAEAKNIELYKFLQFDESRPMLSNPHFNICLSSSPKQGKLYFISEVEYGPQDREPDKRFNRKNRNNPQNPRK